jgi:Protein of unknown function (DUF1592)/Protein of unknown function (DUF1588)/Protein of unknown function (DUF1595)/Protein of unknown function (DUF1587)
VKTAHGLVAATLAFGVAALPACSSEHGSASSPRGAHGAGRGGGGAGALGEAAATSEGGVATSDELIPTRIRRLASAEYDASVQALLSTTQNPASGPDFPPDLRQDGFTVNDAQRVDAVIVERLADAADSLATEAQTNGTLDRLAPCAATDDPTSCAKTFITTFGAKMYRRPLVDDEVNALLTLFSVGADGAAYLDGIAHVTRGLLQSAGFLYLTELGDGTQTQGAVNLTTNELASALSYLITSAPPDDELLAKATAGALSDPDEREAQARRLFATDPAAQDTIVRIVREWLGIDGIVDSAKDSLIYPDFAADKPAIMAESSDFVRAVAFQSTGTVSELLGANWTVNSGPLALYQTAGSGPVPDSTLITDRVGILNQAAFLATYANAHESHPIFRGVAVARRVVCLPLDSPASFDITVVPPAPDPTMTTRERFDAHVVDPICEGCHKIIDPFGFSFEHFDGMGAYRATENGQNVDGSVVVSDNADYDGPYADSNALATALAESPTVRECMARYLFRAAAATGDSAATPGEPQFIDYWHTIPAAAKGNFVETLIAYVKSPNFGVREVP